MKRQQAVHEQLLVTDHAKHLAALDARRKGLLAEQQAAIANTEFAVAERIKSDVSRLDDERAELVAREAARLRAATAPASSGAGGASSTFEDSTQLAIAKCKASLEALVVRQKAAKAVPPEQKDIELLMQLKREIDQAKKDLAAAEQRAVDEEAQKAAAEARQAEEERQRQEAAVAAAASAKAREEEDKAAYEARRAELLQSFEQAEEDDDFDALKDLQLQLQNLNFSAFVEERREREGKTKEERNAASGGGRGRGGAEAAVVARAVKEHQLSPEEQKKVNEELLTASADGDEEGVRDALARGAQPNGAKDVRYLVFV